MKGNLLAARRCSRLSAIRCRRAMGFRVGSRRQSAPFVPLVVADVERYLPNPRILSLPASFVVRFNTGNDRHHPALEGRFWCWFFLHGALIKTCTCRRSQAGQSSSSGAGLQGAKSILADEGVRGLYTGYSSNIAYAFPADAIKFLVRRTR